MEWQDIQVLPQLPLVDRHATSSYTTEMRRLHIRMKLQIQHLVFFYYQRYIPGATGNTTTGYWIGGINGPDKLVTTEKLFSSDSTIPPGADLPTGTGRYSSRFMHK